jgi:hypothetical protein
MPYALCVFQFAEGGRVAACGSRRKVRAPQGRVVVNDDRGRPQGKCHRKHTAPRFRGVRVKRRGKSSPRPWRQGRQGKPHPEQDRIGERLRAARPRLPGRLLDPASNGGARGMATLSGFPGRQNSAYRPASAFFAHSSWQRSSWAGVFACQPNCGELCCYG